MGACKSCGRPAGLGKGECSDCAAIRVQTEKAAGEALEAAEAASREAERRAQIQERVDIIESTVALGREAYLLESFYLPVNSVVNDLVYSHSFEVDPVRAYLLRGWEPCGVVPRTKGEGLQNVTKALMSDTTWGGGMGGNVTGVHLLLRYKIEPGTLEASRGTMLDHFERTIQPSATEG